MTKANDPNALMKVCSLCNELKPMGWFGRVTRCKDGHKARCKACDSEAAAQRYLRDRDKILAKNREWDVNNPDARRILSRDWRREHPESGAQWVADNPEKQAVILSRWQKNHPDKVAANSARRRATKRYATPTWANLAIIGATYTMAAAMTKLTGIKHHVDHVVPLRSKLVSGLHVENNLQILPAAENMKKSNRVWPDMPEKRA